MNTPTDQLRDKLGGLSQEWIANGIPSAEALSQTAAEVSTWKQSHNVVGLWSRAPLMMTATLDDGIGQGLDIISSYATVAGLQVQMLGLMQHPVDIVDMCRQRRPSILGLTILHLDSDEALAHIGHHLPPHTDLVAGGPVFKYDPDMAQRCGVTYVAANVAYFIDFLLNWEPGHDATAG